MCEIRHVKSVEMFPIVKELLAKGKRVRITVTGMSMYPFLREDTDAVELFHGCFASIRHGDIVMIQRDNGQYIMHRMLWKEKDCFHIIGDGQVRVEGPLRPEQIVGVISAVWRRRRRIECSSLLWRFLSSLWLLLLPVRFLISKAVGCFRRLI